MRFVHIDGGEDGYVIRTSLQSSSEVSISTTTFALANWWAFGPYTLPEGIPGGPVLCALLNELSHDSQALWFQ